MYKTTNLKVYGRKATIMLAAALTLSLASCSEKEAETAAYDPNSPIVCESFSPAGGPMSTQVILKGNNFGNDASAIKVYFNEKEAPVVGASGDHILVLAPRLPGDNVVIKVAIGEQESSFDGHFDYEIRTNISTICGGDASATTTSASTTGDQCALSEAQFSYSMENTIEVDKNKNIFFTMDKMVFCANEYANRMKNIDENSVFLTVGQVYYDKYNDKVYHNYSNGGMNEYYYYDVNNDFTKMGKADIQWDNTDFVLNGLGVVGAKRTFAMNPEDGKFYSRLFGGYLVRWDPESGTGENLTTMYGGVGIGTTNGSSYGVVFREQEPNVMYFSNDELSCIFRLDLNTGNCTVFAGRSGSSGYLDGDVKAAQFYSPHQMCVDSEGNIYVADSGNHCIRKINMTTGYVSTVAGIPQSAGYVNGTNESAKFNYPIGLAIDTDDILYVGDRDNHAIRRVAIE